MPSFNQSYKIQNGTCIIEFLEPITEKTTFPPIQPGIRTLEINLDKVTYMSSFGVKLWIEWYSKLPPDTKYLFQKAHPAFINNANMVHGFLPKHSTVLSLYAPYISDDGDVDKLVLLMLEKEYFANGTLKLPVVTSGDGIQLEEDFFPDKYFKFLKIA